MGVEERPGARMKWSRTTLSLARDYQETNAASLSERRGDKNMDRECGTCTLCCKVMGIHALDKPRGVWCDHAMPGRALRHL